MSITSITPNLSELVVPVFESNIFELRPESTYFLGILALPEQVLMPDEFRAARQLRANVYIDQEHYLPNEARQSDGGESDEDDWRSVQFGVIENTDSAAKMVGTSRLIIKSDEARKLPIEIMFPEAFVDEPAPAQSTEASRFIARHPSRLKQGLISLSLIRAMSAWSVAHSLEPAYAVIEKPLARLFDKIALPHDIMADPKHLPEYGNSLNIPIRIIPAEVMGSINSRGIRSGVMEAFFQNTLEDMGLGYFDATLAAKVA